MPPADAAADESLPRDLFVSSVEGQPVTRFGTTSMIGASRSLDGVKYAPDQVVLIPAAEAARYAREYSRAIGDGALTVRKRADWNAQNAKHAEAEAKHAAAKEERRLKREAEAAAAAEKK